MERNLGALRQGSADIAAINLLADFVLIADFRRKQWIYLDTVPPVETCRLCSEVRGTVISILPTATTLQGPVRDPWGTAGTSDTQEQTTPLPTPSQLLSYHLISGRTVYKDMLLIICLSVQWGFLSIN